mmetsp:Transcript_14637/g.30020  ORF Transcript_14637/g.30020 Transcript_14637/m.30020 type:complete len:780 (-) Transcript_14637:229-2568(-)
MIMHENFSNATRTCYIKNGRPANCYETTQMQSKQGVLLNEMNRQASSNGSFPLEEQKEGPEWICSRCSDIVPGEKSFFCHCPNCGNLISETDESGGANPSLSAEEMRHNLLNLAKEKIINKMTLNNYGVAYTEEECEILAEVLQTTTTLEILQLDSPAALRNEKFRYALGQNKTIKELHLRQSGCDDEDARVLASVLKSNETIEWIDLSYNEISDSGAKELGAAFLINKKRWDLHGNYNMSSPVAETLFHVTSRCLLHCTFRWNADKNSNSRRRMHRRRKLNVGRPAYCSPYCLPSNAMREIMQLAGCKIPLVDFDFATKDNINTDLKARRTVEEVVVMKKVERFLSDIIETSLTVAEHLRRIEPCPSDIAYALGRFALREASKKTKFSSDLTFAQLTRAFEVNTALCGNVVVSSYSKRLSQRCSFFEGCCPNPFDDECDEEYELWSSSRGDPDDSDDETWVDEDDYDDEIEHEDTNLSEFFIDDNDDSSDEESYGPYNDSNYLEGGLLPWAVNTTTAMRVPMFEVAYPSVDLAESEVTDQQFLMETLRPLAGRYYAGSQYMGFDLEEEDYVSHAAQCECESCIMYPINRDAPLIINMLKRATYAFAVASVRENIDWLHKQGEGMTDKEKQLQLEIESMREQLKYARIIPTVDLSDETAVANTSSKRRADTEIGKISKRATRSAARSVKVKQENIKEGVIKCPVPNCNNTIVHNGGCHILTCMNHHPRWVYFCAHCKSIGERGSEIIRCDCPRRNTQEDRNVAQAMRNQRAADNPIVLE